MLRRLAGGLVLAAIGAAAAPAGAIEYIAGITPYCRVISAPGGSQELPLTTPIAAGHSVHVAVVTSANVTFAGVSDVSGNAYTLRASGNSGVFGGTIASARIATAVPAGDSITVQLDATGSGSSCVAAFEASDFLSVDRVAFTTGGGSPAALDVGALTATDELVHALLFGAPTSPSNPVATREAPLVAVTSGCVGTSSGQMCSFSSYAEVADAGPLSISQTLSAGLNWGLLAVSYVPEPGADALGVAALLALVGFRQASGPKRSGLP